MVVKTVVKSNKVRTAITILSIAVLTFVLYARHLGDAPIYLSPDEVLIALDAHSIASTAHDSHGRFLPLFFQITDQFSTGWFTPLIFYVQSLVLKILPLSEAAIRLPSVLVGVVDVILMYGLARTIFKGKLQALFAMGLMALTPAHFIHSRLAMDYVYPLPFLMAWLLCLAKFEEHRSPWVLFAGSASLGIGCYSYIASI